MRSTADHQFISTDVDELDALLVAGYEQFFGTSVRPGSPERDGWHWVQIIHGISRPRPRLWW